MKREERVAIGRFVMRTKEYLVAVAVRDERLALTTMRFGDEIRSPKPIKTGGKKPAKAQLDQAVALIEALSEDWDPARHEDRYRKRLEDVIDRKRKGRKISAPEPRAGALAGARPHGRARGEPRRGEGRRPPDPEAQGQAQGARPGASPKAKRKAKAAK